MYPILFSIGPLTLRSYGLMVALGFALSIYLAWREAQREGVDSEKFLDMALWVVISGIIGARILYVVVSWQEFVNNPLAIFKIWQGGLVFYGGFFMAVAAVFIYCRRYQLPLWRIMDICAPYTALGHALGRIGCFLNGCCYGRPHETWGVVFPSLQDNIPRLPTQLFESGINLILFVGLLFLRRRQHFAGQILWTYVFCYAVLRFILEFFRGDEIRGSFLYVWLHTSQLIALMAMGLAVGMLIFLRYSAKRKK